MVTLTVLTTTAQANVLGTYLRDDVEPITAHIEEGLLYCTRISDGYELCNGMAEQADGSWQGDKLKNPDMPGFMKFSGTIVFEEDQMILEGCTMGGKVCKSKTWPMQP
jgi:uncharacterized protein (DUF2147 family)